MLLKKLFYISAPLFLPILLISIATAQKINQDSRYALHPFTSIIVYRLNYSWTDNNGRTLEHSAGAELRDEAAKLLNSHSWNIGYYGFGAIRREIQAYLKYICHNILPKQADSCSAALEYRINPRRHEGEGPEFLNKINFTYQKLSDRQIVEGNNVN